MGGDSGSARKPTVVVSVAVDRSSDVVREVLAGLEEEQVPFEVVDGSGDLAAAASDAAKQSKLRVGVSIFGDGRLCVQHASLPESAPLLRFADADAEVGRRAGANAARLVKGTPLRVPHEDALRPVRRIGTEGTEDDVG